MAPNILNRQHNFHVKSTFLPQNCQQCELRIAFGTSYYKCQDCRWLCHAECRREVPLSCVPIVSNSFGSKHAHLVTITEYAPPIRPMVPALIVHCTNEIETRGLNKAGIYRISGIKTDVIELRNRFLEGKSLPKLTTINIHVITGALKSFLMILKEPLIPRALWYSTVMATKESHEMDIFASVCNIVSQMPDANRDTLAWIILHLQRISECMECRMDENNLATVFGPSMVGYSLENPNEHQLREEIKEQKQVMLMLLKIPDDYWKRFIEKD